MEAVMGSRGLGLIRYQGLGFWNLRFGLKVWCFGGWLVVGRKFVVTNSSLGFREPATDGGKPSHPKVHCATIQCIEESVHRL